MTLKNDRANSPVMYMSCAFQEPSGIMVEVVDAAYSQVVFGVAAAGNNVVSYTGQNTREDLQLLSAVAASDRADNRAYFSTWGPGVDAFAPESDIYSAWAGSNIPAYLLASGTNMATPHVAGLVAYLRAASAEDPNISASAITQRIKDLTLNGVVIKDPRGSPDLLIDNNSRKRSMLIQA